MIKSLAVIAALALALSAPAMAEPVAASGASSGDSGWVTPDLQRMVQPDNAQRLAALKALLTERGIAFTVHDFPGSPDSKGVAGQNVVVTIGDGPRDLVLGAHYDAVIQDNGRAVDGLVDNGGSVVALVRAAESLQGYGPKHRVLIVFFDQEELGLLGSAAWLKSVDKSRIDAAVVFDVDANGDTFMYGGLKNDARGVVRAAMGSVCTLRAWDCLRFEKYPPSDDRSFAAAGVPVISIGQQPARDAHQMWLLENAGKDAGLAQGVLPGVFTTIHSPKDNMTAVEPAAVNRAFEMAFEIIRALDEQIALPAQ